jgi:hypothetical protein
MKYYYDPITGIFQMRCNRAMPTDLPSIEREEGWFYSDYRVEIETGELIYTPSKRNPRS